MKMTASLDRIANVALIITCAVVTYALIGHLSRTQPNPDAGVQVGGKLDPLPAVKYDQSQWTAILYVKSTCPYCTDSMGLYRSISALPSRKSGTLRFVAVSTESRTVSSAYLSQHAVTVDQIVEVLAGRPTPTLVLVDRSGVVRNFWLGRQDAAGAQKILNTLAGS